LLDRGEAFAPLPKHVSEARAKSFRVGGLVSRRDVNAWFVEHIRTVWQCDVNGTLVLQDILARPDDPAVRNSNQKRLIADASVYFILEHGDLDPLSVQSAIRAVASFLFIAFLSRFSVRYNELPSDHVVEETLIDHLARDIEEVFVGAYDQEGLVVWRRPALQRTRSMN
jgi:hypothetical protein